MSFDIVNDSAIENELPSTSAPTGVPAHLHTNMQSIVTNTHVSDTESDMPYRPDSFTRVEMQNVQSETCIPVRKVPVNHSGHVDGEDVTCQDGCAKGSSNHSDHWKRVISFGTASTDLIIPADDDIPGRMKPCSNRKRRTRQSRTYKCKKKTTSIRITHLYQQSVYSTSQTVALQIQLCLIMMSFKD